MLIIIIIIIIITTITTLTTTITTTTIITTTTLILIIIITIIVTGSSDAARPYKNAPSDISLTDTAPALEYSRVCPRPELWGLIPMPMLRLWVVAVKGTDPSRLMASNNNKTIRMY